MQAPSHIFIVADEHAEALFEQAATKEVEAVVRAERYSGEDFANIPLDALCEAAARAVNGLLPGAHAPIAPGDVRVRRGEHKGGAVVTYKLRITCSTAMHAQALAEAIADLGGLVMQLGERSNVPAMPLMGGQPTDAMYMLHISSRHKLSLEWLYHTLSRDMGIKAVWLAALDVPQDQHYGEPLLRERYWPDAGAGEQHGMQGIHPYFLQGVAARAHSMGEEDDRHYLALVDGFHGAVNTVVAAVRAAGKVVIGASAAALARARQSGAPAQGTVELRVERFIPRMPPPPTAAQVGQQQTRDPPVVPASPAPAPVAVPLVAAVPTEGGLAPAAVVAAPGVPAPPADAPAVVPLAAAGPGEGVPPPATEVPTQPQPTAPCGLPQDGVGVVSSATDGGVEGSEGVPDQLQPGGSSAQGAPAAPQTPAAQPPHLPSQGGPATSLSTAVRRPAEGAPEQEGHGPPNKRHAVTGGETMEHDQQPALAGATPAPDSDSPALACPPDATAGGGAQGGAAHSQHAAPSQ